MAGKEYLIPTEPLRMRDMPEGLRPREEVDRVGIEHVGDDVLLALLLRCGTPGKNASALARELVMTYGSLSAMASASIEDLRRHKGVGKVKAQILRAALELARRMAQEQTRGAVYVRTPEDAARLVRAQAQTMTGEVFWVIMLNAKNGLKAIHEVSKGILDASIVHPREVFKRAIETLSAAVIVAHNHPSGDPLPSAEDVRITRQLVDAGKVIGIRVLDHIVVGKKQAGRENDFVSLRESGMLDFGVNH